MEGGAVHASYFDIEPCMEEEKKKKRPESALIITRFAGRCQ